MPTATLEKKKTRAKAMSPPQQFDEADTADLLESARYRQRVFEHQLMRRTEAGESLQPDDFLLGRSAALTDEQIKSEFVRIKRLVAFVQTAGTGSDRSAARTRRDATGKALDTRGQEIDTEIAALQQKKADLESAANAAKRESAIRDQSADRIVSIGLPPDVGREIQRQLSTASPELRAELKAVSRLASDMQPPLSNLLNLRIGGASLVESYCARHNLPSPLNGRSEWAPGGQESLRSHLQSREAERQKLFARKAELEARLADEAAAVRDQLIDEYLSCGQMPALGS